MSRSLWADLVTSNVFQWNAECFFSGHMELNSRFMVMTIHEFTLNRPKKLFGLQRHLLILSVGALQIRLEVLHWDLHSLRFVSTSEWVLGIRSLFRTIFLYHLQLGIWTPLPFVRSILLSHWFFEDKFLMRQNFPILQYPQSECLLLKFSPRWIHTQERLLVKLSCQIVEVLIGLALKCSGIQPLLQKELLVLWMVLRIVFHMELSRLLEGLGHFADCSRFPWNQLTVFHPILIATKLLKYPLSLFVQLFQLYHFVSDEVSKFDGSMIIFHNFCQIPMNCQCK